MLLYPLLAALWICGKYEITENVVFIFKKWASARKTVAPKADAKKIAAKPAAKRASVTGKARAGKANGSGEPL